MDYAFSLTHSLLTTRCAHVRAEKVVNMANALRITNENGDEMTAACKSPYETKVIISKALSAAGIYINVNGALLMEST